jgi:predicted aspartyl protease
LSEQQIDTPGNTVVQLGTSWGAIMSDAVGSFRVDVEVENPARPGERRLVSAVLVDTGAELSWLPAAVLESLGIERYNRWRFRQADGTILERWAGAALLHVAGKRTSDDVVFGEPGDLVLLGSRSLEGLNFRIEPVTKQLVDAGPAPAAAARRSSRGTSPRQTSGWSRCCDRKPPLARRRRER